MAKFTSSKKNGQEIDNVQTTYASSDNDKNAGKDSKRSE